MDIGIVISTVFRTIFFRMKSHLFCTLLICFFLSFLICASTCFLQNSFAAVNISRIFPSISRIKVTRISFLLVLRTACFLIMMPLNKLIIIFHQFQPWLTILKQIYLSDKSTYDSALQSTYFAVSLMNIQNYQRCLISPLLKLFGC